MNTYKLKEMDAVRIRQIETHSSCVGNEPLKNIKEFHCSSYAQGFARIHTGCREICDQAEFSFNGHE